MSALQEKYGSVIAAARQSGISDLQVTEQNGILYISGKASTTAQKDNVWNALGVVDSSFSASDINIDVQVEGLVSGTNLTVDTEDSNLNIRTEPSTESSIAGKASKGELVTLIEQTSADWWKIRTSSGEVGYAYSRYLKV